MMRKILPVVTGLVGLALLLWFIVSIKFLSWDFRNNLWAPAYLLVHGRSAYDIKSIFAESNAIWFPQIIGLLFPLGWLTQYQATNLWLAVNIFLLVFLVWFLLKQNTQKLPKPWLFGCLVLSVFIFPPTVRFLILGQADVVLIFVLIAGVYALEKQRLALSGFLFSLALAKPQLCVLVLPGVFGYIFFVKKEWQTAVKLLVAICLIGLMLTMPLWFSDPNWGRDFLTNLTSNPQWDQPSIFSTLQSRMGVYGLVLWLLIFAITLAASLHLWSRLGPYQGVLWSLALTTIVSPYVWSWDFVLLLPIFIRTAIKVTNPLARFTLFIFYVVSFVLSVVILRIPGSSDKVLWWFPFLILFGVAISLLIDVKSKSHELIGQT